ncbi:cyclophilin-like fold protein [Arcicella rosea]|uniref:Cyclophilin-like domain-containing protein n=1 Tax=Arcicella rosea TaxID=502909 RepID=A0A841ES12_9BACT|nr:cyclophilin-like fold protein [Arcicella rosea]MBB6003468.1 hypothetical protein [Arcicella rosea]
MKIISFFLVSLIYIQLFACNKNGEVNPTNTSNTDNTHPLNPSNQDSTTNSMKMKVTIGTNVFTATFNNNATATAFKAQLPMTINMTDLNANEKFFDLPNALPTNASNPETIQNGDLRMYGSNTLVLFYKTFSTSYRYTPLGRIDNPAGLAAALGKGNVMVKFELE